MNPRLHTLALARIACLSLLACVTALWLAGMAQEGKRVEPTTFQGTVMMVGDSMLVIQMAPDSDAVTFRVSSGADITRNGEKAALSKLQMGDSVTLTAERHKDEMVASSVTARAPY